MSATTEARTTSNMPVRDLRKGHEILLVRQVNHVGEGTRVHFGTVQRPVYFAGFSEPVWLNEDDVLEVVE